MNEERRKGKERANAPENIPEGKRYNLTSRKAAAPLLTDDASDGDRIEPNAALIQGSVDPDKLKFGKRRLRLTLEDTNEFLQSASDAEIIAHIVLQTGSPERSGSVDTDKLKSGKRRQRLTLEDTNLFLQASDSDSEVVANTVSQTGRPQHSELDARVAVEALIEDHIPPFHNPNFYVPPPEARYTCNRNFSATPGPMNPEAPYENPSQLGDIELDSTKCDSNFDPPFQFAYTEQQVYNVHLGILESDFDDNSYENKLHVMKSARRTQLRGELLSLKILSQVREELGAVEDLLRPWM